jgi:hypothetical protein
MVTVVSPTLINLAGLAAIADEPHVREGNHLRVASNPLLGLPVAPFVIQRANLGDRQPDSFAARSGIVFRDADDRILTLPINVSKGDVIRATIPQGPALTCIMVMMQERPQPTNDERSRPRPIRSMVDPNILRALLNQRNSAEAPNEAQLVMRAFAPSIAQGPVLVGRRRAAPYTICAPSIAEVEITGSGVIAGMTWIAAQDTNELRWQTIDVLNMPHKAGLRYLSVSDPIGRAEGRMRGQAPKRRPLQETIGATAPMAAAVFSEDEESDRIHTLADPVGGDLDALIDGPDAPLTASETIPVTDASGAPLATAPGEESSISISHLGRVLQATLDPGVAAWLGFKGLDQKTEEEGLISFYRVIGFFDDPLEIGATAEQLIGLSLSSITQNERHMGGDAVFDTVMKLAGNLLQQEGRQLEGKIKSTSGFAMMAAIAAVDRRAPADPPSRPVMLAPEHVAWLPAVPPKAIREVDCPMKGVLVGATLAAEREQPVPGGHAGLNHLASGGTWHLPLTLGLNTTADGKLIIDQDGRQGLISDRTVGADGARYHVAQQDRFGRWSDFAGVDAAPGPRPKPPRPVLQGWYNTPSLDDAATAGGTVILRVALPEPEALAPGSFPLSHVRLSLRHHNIDTPTAEVALPDLNPGVDEAKAIDTPPPGEESRKAVPAEVPGPLLQATEQRRMVVTAVWFDTGGQQSIPSEPLRLLMTDPRPPAQLMIPDVLLYSARPDATGLAWVERTWTPAPGASYAVYYSDEVRLISWLRADGRTAQADDITATADRAKRAVKLRGIKDFPDHLFERLAGAVDTPAPGRARFRHALSGSSRVLNAYKIAVEASISGARPALSGLDTVLYGVPNSDPPPRPVVSVTLSPPLGGEPSLVAEVTVTLEPGVTSGKLVRIYRTRGGPADPMHAPLITTTSLSQPDVTTKRQTAVFRDTGAALIAPNARLSAFSRYQWFAEVQGAPESGSNVPGLWSRASDPSSLAIIPLGAPAAPICELVGIPVDDGTQGLTLKLSHPLDLSPTPLGSWRYEVLRGEPNGAWTLLTSAEINERAPVEIKDNAAGGITSFGTLFRVVVIDPTGQSSPPLTVVTGS